MPRMSIYVSDRRDLDILNALSDIPEGDRSWYLKELLRDGLRYRNGIEPPTSVMGRSTQVIIPGAPLPSPKQAIPKVTKQKKVKKEEPKEEIKEEPKVDPSVEVVVEEPIPAVKERKEEKSTPTTGTTDFMELMNSINLDDLTIKDDDFDDIEDKLDSL